MEFWPKKGVSKKEVPLVLNESFDPPGFKDWEIKDTPRDFDNISTSKEFIESIDFSTLNEIFDELAEKSVGKVARSATPHRVNPEQITFATTLSGEELTVETPTVRFGTANVFSGDIALRWEEDVPPSSERTIDVLKTLLHESTHVRGGYKEEDLKYGFLIRRGMYEYSYIDGVKNRFALSLNEGVTEEIAIEALREYLARTGNSGYMKNKELVQEIGGGSYVTDRLMLAVVINALAKELQIDREIVWRGFVNAYMNGNEEIVGLMLDMSEELTNMPAIQDLAYGLLKEETNEKLDLISMEEILARVKENSEKLSALQQVIGVLDIAKFKNVLGLR